MEPPQQGALLAQPVGGAAEVPPAAGGASCRRRTSASVARCGRGAWGRRLDSACEAQTPVLPVGQAGGGGGAGTPPPGRPCPGVGQAALGQSRGHRRVPVTRWVPGSEGRHKGGIVVSPALQDWTAEGTGEGCSPPLGSQSPPTPGRNPSVALPSAQAQPAPPHRAEA
ncbi:hypothetical protein HJG60_009640 [Phyllostomus discolor]|uniref:Uncharacterized protein n=1 Tax=Phyllostomus discolor TaxID=89673 RepID=A0A834EQ37_9CHIR|nr:hypothetical protein HJG60_009640 [Phyllostomus discolor]